MLILVISLIILGIVALLLGYFRERRIQKQLAEGKLKEAPETVIPDDECCGQHAVCEKDSLLAGISKTIVYYDDEELDAYKGIPANQYTEEQIEQFRDIFYTMQETDVAGWSRSLQLRGIELPEPLRDEVFLIVGERRFRHSN